MGRSNQHYVIISITMKLKMSTQKYKKACTNSVDKAYKQIKTDRHKYKKLKITKTWNKLHFCTITRIINDKQPHCLSL